MLTTCKHCNAAVPPQERNCPSCGLDAGFPNVRECGTEPERNALAQRARAALARAESRGAAEAATRFSEAVEKLSGVVVTMPATMANSLLDNEYQMYTSYEQLVGAGARTIADTPNDRRRRAIDSVIFGSNSPEIRFGVLSLTNLGLTTYGSIHARLKQVSVEHRTTFLESNTFELLAAVKAGEPVVPPGTRAVWANRHELAIAKCEPRINKATLDGEWPQLLVAAGKTRADDSFIEAHVFGGFNSTAIDSIEAVVTERHSPTEKLLAKAVSERFTRTSE